MDANSRVWLHLLWVLILCAFGPPTTCAAGNRVALLIGISDYQHITSPEGPLEGPANDVAALRTVLIERWGFRPDSIRTLVDKQATRDAMLKELRALAERSRNGDDVFIFYSGHGTSSLDSQTALPLPHGTGAMVPYDYDPRVPPRLAGLIVGRRDLRPIIASLEAGGRRLWVVSDSCYSGEQVRAVFQRRGPLPGKYLPLPELQLQQDRVRADAARMQQPEPYPYRNTVYLAAAAEGEIARDIPARQLARFPTLDGKPHGALADALLRVLAGRLHADYNRDGLLDWSEIYAAVREFMADRAYGHTPQRLPAVAEDVGGLGQRAFLGQRVGSRAKAPASAASLTLAQEGLDRPQVESLQRIRGVEVIDAAVADVLIKKTGADIVLYSAGGDRLAEVDAADRYGLARRVQQLAWSKRLRNLGERYARGLLPLEVNPAVFGGNLTVGQRISFVVKPDRPGTLLLINVDAEGCVSVLYPQRPDEMQSLPAGIPRHVPSQEPHDMIQVTPPYGMDLVFAFAFDRQPQKFERVLKLSKLDPTDPRLATIEGMISDDNAGFTFGRAELRTLEAVGAAPEQ